MAESISKRANNLKGVLKLAEITNKAYRYLAITEAVIAPALLAVDKFITPILTSSEKNIGIGLIAVTAVSWLVSSLDLSVRRYQADEISNEAEKILRKTPNLGSGERHKKQ